jgi:mono/diheme cytochrome c family protein
MKISASALVVLLFFAGCTKKSGEKAVETAIETSAEATLRRGRSIYQTQCTSCHGSDPKRAGALGPDVFGSSRELLERRILHGDYPAGHKPKSPSKVMVALPHLKNEIDALTAYLNSP